MMMTHTGSLQCGTPAERRRLTGCAVVFALLMGGTAAAQPASQPTVGGDNCVLAAARIDPAVFARALARHPQALQGCEIDAAGEAARSGAPLVRTPSTVRVGPTAVAPMPVAPLVPEVMAWPARRSAAEPAPAAPASAEPASVAPARPAAGIRRTGTTGARNGAPDRAFNERMRLLDPQVLEVAQRNDIDPLLLHALIHVESRHRPDAVSPAGARGAMQLIPQTAARFGVQNTRHLHELEFNLAAGAAYLKMLQAEFGGDLDLALAAYNAGEGAVRRHGGRIPPYPETQAYVREVRAMHGRLQAEREGSGARSAAPARLAMTELAP
jgi:soluble lytic murein transglycosylase-like protein